MIKKKAGDVYDEPFRIFRKQGTNTVINVNTEEKEIFYGKIVDLSEEDASRYWVIEGGVLLENEVTILVEHEDEVNRKLEEQNEISFRKIFEYMREDITLSLELKHQYDLVIKSANQYNFYRNMILGEENMEAINKKRNFIKIFLLICWINMLIALKKRPHTKLHGEWR